MDERAKVVPKMGRPQIDIDQDAFEKLCGIFCTLDDIANFFKCSADTIDRWCKRTYGETFAVMYKRFSVKGVVSLRRKQFEEAMSGNTRLLEKLGEYYLNQKSSIDVNHNTHIKVTVETLKEAISKDPFIDALDVSPKEEDGE